MLLGFLVYARRRWFCPKIRQVHPQPSSPSRSFVSTPIPIPALNSAAVLWSWHHNCLPLLWMKTGVIFSELSKARRSHTAALCWERLGRAPLYESSLLWKQPPRQPPRLGAAGWPLGPGADLLAWSAPKSGSRTSHAEVSGGHAKGRMLSDFPWGCNRWSAIEMLSRAFLQQDSASNWQIWPQRHAHRWGGCSHKVYLYKGDNTHWKHCLPQLLGEGIIVFLHLQLNRVLIS